MNLIDDPRLTAYALNEMPEADRAAFEAELANDPAAQAEVTSIRSTAAALREDLRRELAGLPTAPPDASMRSERRRPLATHWKLAAAAAVVVGGLLTAALVNSSLRGRDPVLVGRGTDTRTVVTAPTTAPATQPPTMRPNLERVLAANGSMSAANANSTPTAPGAGSGPEQQGQAGAQGVAARTEAGDAWQDAFTTGLARGARVPSPTPLAAVEPGASGNIGVADGQLRVGERLSQVNGQGVSTPTPYGLATASPQPVNAADVLGREVAAIDPPAAVDGGQLDVRLNASNQPLSQEALAFRGRVSSEANELESEVRRRDQRFHLVPDPRLVPVEPVPVRNSETYAPIVDNPFLSPTAAPLSTFGVDVDTASFANVRRFIQSNALPPADAVRIEELINYFPTSDAPPTDGKPFAVRTEVGECPWAPQHRLVRIALKGQVIDNAQRPPSNLVFLVDVSGSMDQPNKLPLVQRSLRKLVNQLGENDRVAIVVYAGSSGLVLPSTSASDRQTILNAIDNLRAGGSTNGGEGIELAYKTSTDAFIQNGTNRVILCTDGDFNVGITDRTALFNLIAQKAQGGVFLSVCGFGTGNTRDDTMEGLADRGNGQYAYIDSDREAEKVFVGQIGGTLVTIAKDVKLQLEFNPATVKSYRLIGYENRVMAAQDFNNDLRDSGDIGAGHSVVALYEIEPIGVAANGPVPVEGLRYQPAPPPVSTVPVADGAHANELLTLKLRYKAPDAPLEQGTSELIETTIENRVLPMAQMSEDFRFAASVAGFGMMLRQSPHKASCSWDLVRSLASSSVGIDAGGYRSEFVGLIDQASRLRP